MSATGFDVGGSGGGGKRAETAATERSQLEKLGCGMRDFIVSLSAPCEFELSLGKKGGDV
jgi:hypothetical protein